MAKGSLKQFTNWIKRTWQDFAGWVIYEWNSWMNSIRFKNAVKEADRSHKLTGKRYHVLPGGKNKLVVVDNEDIRRFNKTLPPAKRLTIDQLLKQSYYSTSVRPLISSK
jgi:hypothetical protein